MDIKYDGGISNNLIRMCVCMYVLTVRVFVWPALLIRKLFTIPVEHIVGARKFLFVNSGDCLIVRQRISLLIFISFAMSRHNVSHVLC